MHSLSPLSVCSRTLLWQLDLQCILIRKQLAFVRQASSAAGQTAVGNKTPAIPTSKPSFSPQIGPRALKDENDHDPKPLNRPLGLQTPPKAGENSGIDLRDWRTRRDDFLNYDKHLERRKVLTKQVSRSYFKDWSNMRFQKGKVFIAPDKLLRSDKALYFPNLRGVTLEEPKDEQDTTPTLSGRLSVVAVFTGTWAENQTMTFLRDNEKLDQILNLGKGFIQRVDINIEENRLRAGLVRLFMGSLKRKLPEEQHGRYYLVTRGVTDDIRENLGMFNRQVGYIYLLDSKCRVRWACSAEALPGEKESMLRGLARLTKEFKTLAEEQCKSGKWSYLDIHGQPLSIEGLNAKESSISRTIEM